MMRLAILGKCCKSKSAIPKRELAFSKQNHCLMIRSTLVRQTKL